MPALRSVSKGGNGRTYDPWLGRMLQPDNYVQAAGYLQNYNRYSYAMNNPLRYVDPSREYIPFFIVPNISWSPQGGLNVGIMAGIGLPGAFSAQVGVSYNVDNHDATAFVSSSAYFNTVYASYNTRSGFSVGYTAGLTIYSGVPISSNVATVGVNYNISNNTWSGNVSAMQVDNNGWTFNPSISVMVAPEETTNLIRGQGFRNNNQVLSRFVKAKDYNGALEYFGFEGVFDADANNPGNTDLQGNITYNSIAFSKGYDYFHYVASEEMFHQRDILAGNYNNVDWDDKLQKNDALAEGEYKANMYQYRNQGPFPRHGQSKLMLKRINYYGDWLGKFKGNYSSDYGFQAKPWHVIYKIPRKW